MRCLNACLIMLLVAGGAVPATAEEPGAMDDTQRVAEIQAQMLAGKTEEAITAAKAFLRTAKDETSKTEAMRVLAEGLRKSGNWQSAIGAYRALRDRFEKSSDEYLRCGAIADVLAGSRDGIYKGAGAATGAEGTEVKKVSDDEGLNAALALLAQSRCARLKSKAALLQRARTPQELLRTFGPVAEEARQIFILAADTPPDDVRAMGKTAGERLAQIHMQANTVLQKKLQDYQQTGKFRRPWSFTNIEKKDIKDTNLMCKDMAAAEREFQTALASVAGSGEWAEGAALRTESTERAAAYEQLAKEFVVPAYEIIFY